MKNKYKIYDYILAKGWQYWVTLTFNPDKVNRYDDNAVKELWSKFVLSCEQNNPDCAILVISERDKHRVIHFHALMSDIDLQLIPVTDKNGNALKDSFGNVIFEVGIWEYGFGVAIELPKDDSYNEVVNSLIKYLSIGIPSNPREKI